MSFNFSVFPPGGARAPRDPDSPPVELKMHKPGPGAITLGVLIAIGAVVYGASIVWTEILWFRQMSATRVILTQWGAHIGLFVVGFIVATALIFFSMSYAYRHRASSTRGQASASLRAYQKALEPVRRFAFWGAALFFGFTNGARLATEWQTLLQFLNRSSFDQVDPQFGMDISFFVFVLPALKVLVSFLLTVTAIALVAALIVSYLYGTIRLAPRPHASKQARLQSGMMAACLSLFIGVHYWLGRYELLTSDSGSIHGAMYSDINATLPAHSILAVISGLVAVLFVVAAFTDRLDGQLARSWGLVTSFGKIADPIADKALTLSAFVLLSINDRLWWWVTILIVVRELGITVMRFFMLRRAVMAASRGGKIKTALQMVGLVGLLTPWSMLLLPVGLVAFLTKAAYVIVAAALVVTVVTGLDYVRQAMLLSRENGGSGQ